jgi:hypothetical protein
MDPKLQTMSESFARGLTNAFIETLNEQITTELSIAVLRELQTTDFKQLIKSYVAENVRPVMRDQIIQSLKSQIADAAASFPQASIPGSCINLSTLRISGDSVLGGVHQSFQSTGLQDSATECQITILDKATVFENKLIAKSLEVKGLTVIDGDIIIKGQTTADTPFFKQIVEYTTKAVRDTITPDFFNEYRDEMFDKIEQEGLHVKELTVNGKEIVSGNQLGMFVTESNLQAVGELRQLQVKGETLLFNTAYIGNKRVGINTLEPSSALTIWDEEVEISIGKRRQDVAIISAPRQQSLVLSSGNKDNIVLGADGTTLIKKLVIGKVEVSSSPTMPTEKAKKGTIVFNESPDIGQPVGWISLDGNRWAEFGKIG